jgi:hypothetical protein
MSLVPPETRNSLGVGTNPYLALGREGLGLASVKVTRLCEWGEIFTEVTGISPESHVVIVVKSLGLLSTFAFPEKL